MEWTDEDDLLFHYEQKVLAGADPRDVLLEIWKDADTMIREAEDVDMIHHAVTTLPWVAWTLVEKLFPIVAPKWVD